MQVTMRTSAMPVLMSDFNTLGQYCHCRKRNCGHILGLLGDWDVDVGQRVVIADHEGNDMQGVVEGFRHKKYALVRCDVKTWRDSPRSS